MDDYNLTQLEAIQRREVIDTGLSYQVYLDLRKGKEYSGIVRIGFNVIKEGVTSTFLEYVGKSVSKGTLNGTELPLKEDGGLAGFTGNTLKLDNLVLGQNYLVLFFANEYGNDGNGFHTYTDIEGCQYTYSQSEAHYGSRIFPMFDQPDLRGTFELTVRGPTDWTIISNEFPTPELNTADFKTTHAAGEDEFKKIVAGNILNFEEETRFVSFGATHPLPTYLFTVITGPFKEIKCPADQLHNGIPMSIYCRSKMFKYVEKITTETFEFNAKGIDVYEKLFGYDYPFSKCDTIFCPEYSCGAMENPGAITYSEQRYVFTHEPSVGEMTEFGSTILHELAHMWFGDLVTMKWWNDLWLNESFADFVCYICLADLHGNLTFEIDDGWLAMQLRKTFGYKADQSRTTHPIAAKVPTVDDAFAIFDGITYSKGASTLRQMYSLIGRENFSKAMKSYFNKFAWNNTTLEDLLSEMQASLGEAAQSEAFNLTKFRADWIESTGMNTLTAEWDPKSTSSEAVLTLIQGNYHEEYQMFRYHKILVGFYGENGTLLETKEVIVQKEEKTVITYDATQGVQAIIPNIGDLTFIEVCLDMDTVLWIKKNYQFIEDDITRALIWRCFYDGVRDAKTIRSFDYIMLVVELLKHEKKASIIEFIDEFLKEVVSQFSQAKNLETYLPKLWNAIHDVLAASKCKQTIKLLQKMIVRYANGHSVIDKLRLWFDGEYAPFAAFKPTLEQQWEIVFLINSDSTYSTQDHQKYVDLIQDDTDRKNEWLLKLSSFKATGEEREKIYQDCISPKCSMSYHMLQFAAKGINNSHLDIKIRSSFFKHFTDNMASIFNAMNKEYGRVIVQHLVPATDDLDWLIPKLEEQVKLVENSYLKKILNTKIDNFIRMKKVQAFGVWISHIIEEN